MQPPGTINNMFHFEYYKSIAEIQEKMASKLVLIKKKIIEREQRITALRTEHGIDDRAMISLLQQARNQQHRNAVTSYTYSSNTVVPGQMEEKMIGAGIINHLLTENDFMEAEKIQVRELEFILRNLRPIKVYASETGVEVPGNGISLSKEALEYLGF